MSMFQIFHSNFLLSRKGFTLLEVLLGITLLVFVSLSLYSLYNFGLNVVWESKVRVDATALANERLERARNLSYASVGTIGGIPLGSIAQSEVVVRNGVSFTVQTNVLYIDDPFDGTVTTTPQDLLNSDYKRVRVSVSWPYRLAKKPVVFLTDVVPKGIESTLGGGTLRITVFNSSGVPVQSANVHIVNSAVDPPIDLQTLTDANGIVVLPGAPPSTDHYEISVTKAGYSTDQTLPVSQSNPSPAKPHVSVFENQLSEVSFSIDTLSTIQIVTNLYPSSSRQPFVSFKLSGSRTIGTDGNGKPIYKYVNTLSTDANGYLEVPAMEWDSYTFSLATSTVYDLAAISPLNPIIVPAAATQLATLWVYPHSNHSFSLAVKNSSNALVPGVLVQIASAPGFLATSTTENVGQVFFADLNAGLYDLNATSSGYQPYVSQVSVSGWTQETITMAE